VVRTLVEQIHRELRDRVLAGRWRLGERLYEEAIASELGVSRAPVREAIRMLEQEHLIVRHPHRGLFVASPTAGEILQVASYRALLEVYAVRWGRPHTRDEIDTLNRTAAAMDVAAACGDVLAAVTEDLRFHGIVASVCDNAALLGHFHELDGHMALFLHALTDDDRDPAAAMGDRHREVVRALATGPGAADPAIIEHYRSASLALIERSGATAGGDWSSKWRLA
jgi:DNA-binding GntR family transcriptional regulator